ncbi:MAG: hypothetical protein ACFFB2_17130 [Promethearchaeota archaeon]
MSELPEINQRNVYLMIQKLRMDPDKYERMFAAQYLAKYNFSSCKEHLKRAILGETDPEVIECIKKLLENKEVRT